MAALLGEWLTLLPKRAVPFDRGCGGGQDARYLSMPFPWQRPKTYLERFGATTLPSARHSCKLSQRPNLITPRRHFFKCGDRLLGQRPFSSLTYREPSSE